MSRNVDLTPFVALYAAMYAAYGVASPFLPAYVHARGIPAEQLGLVLGAGTAMRLLSATFVGRLADFLQALRTTLVVCVALASAVTLFYLPAHGFSAFFAVSLLQALTLAPMTVLADALALGAARRAGFEYGWVRGTGSAAFIVATLVSGQFVAAQGLKAAVSLQSILLVVAAIASMRVPEIPHPMRDARAAGVMRVLKIPAYRTMVAIAALVLGSHALHDGFAVIRWTAAGIAPGTVSLLWSEAVLAEVIVFFWLGPRLLIRIGPAGALALASASGIARWAAMASTVSVGWIALLQPLHGVTFALLHLACMRVIARVAPAGLEGTAQALYGTGIGAASAAVMMSSGALYAELGGEAFWIMAMVCAIALPLTLRLPRLSPLH
jgi:MFS transporter, PPP family, 3-phenylpropionic acid transporter